MQVKRHAKMQDGEGKNNDNSKGMKYRKEHDYNERGKKQE